MQILPGTLLEQATEASYSLYGSDNASSAAQTAFDDLLQNELNAPLDSTSTDTRTWFAAATGADQDPGAATAQDNASLLSLKVTPEDFAALEENLRQSGLSEDSIDTLRDEVNSESGVTWKNFLDRLDEELRQANNQTSRSEGLTEDEQRQLTNLFAKLGFTPQQCEQLLTDISGGRQEAAWVAISNKIARMATDQTITVGKQELSVLGKAMGLPDSIQDKLATLFGGRENVDILPEDLRMVVTLMRKEGLLARRQLITENGDLRQALSETMEQAKGRSDIEALADNKQTRESEASQVLIKDAAEERFGERRARANEQDRIGDKRTRVDANESGWERRRRVDENLRQGAQAVEQERDVEADAHQRLAKEGAGAGKNGSAQPWGADDKYQAGKDPERSLNGDGRGNGESPWEALARRIRFQGGETATSSASATLSAQAAEAAAESAVTGTQRSEAPLSQRILQTIQDGVLRNLGQGRNQIVLRLDPPSLGKVSVILQVHNREVTAVIKTENQDVTNLVSEQLQHIRRSLEEQGLKVQKLDVETQLDSEQPSQWLGMEQHNQTREQEAQEDILAAWRRLVGGNREQDLLENETAAQTPNPIRHTGLDLIA